MQQNNYSSAGCLVISAAALLMVALSLADLSWVASATSALHRSKHINIRAAPSNHHSVMHSHMSRKIFERACAANKDTLDEIIKCLVSNKHLMELIKKEDTLSCHKDAFGVEFNHNDTLKHRDLICNNRDKFEEMTACVYRKTAEASTEKEIEKLTEAMVDVGLCILNALDG